MTAKRRWSKGIPPTTDARETLPAQARASLTRDLRQSTRLDQVLELALAVGDLEHAVRAPGHRVQGGGEADQARDRRQVVEALHGRGQLGPVGRAAVRLDRGD